MSIVTDMDLYTIEQLFSECVGRYVTLAQRSTQSRNKPIATTSAAHPQLRLVSLIDKSTYQLCWQAFTNFILRRFDEGRSFYVEPIGVLMFECSPALSSIGKTETKTNSQPPASFHPSLEEKTRKFYFLPDFVHKYHLPIDQSQIFRVQTSNLYKLKTFQVAQYSKLELTTLEEALSHVFCRLGEVIRSQSHRMLIDFGVGSLILDKGRLEFRFHDLQDAVPSMDIIEMHEGIPSDT